VGFFVCGYMGVETGEGFCVLNTVV